MSQDQAMAAFHAAKMAQLNAMGHGLDKIQPGLLPPSLDIAKVNNNQNSTDSFLSKIQSNTSVTIEPANNNSTNKLPPSANSGHSGLDIKRDISSVGEPMDLGHDNDRNSTVDRDRERHSSMNDDGNSSEEERNYSDDEGQAVAAN